MFYKKIRDLREDNDLKQRDLADYLNCTQVSYSYYEIGRRDIPTEVLIKLAKFYNCKDGLLIGTYGCKRTLPYQKYWKKQP